MRIDDLKAANEEQPELEISILKPEEIMAAQIADQIIAMRSQASQTNRILRISLTYAWLKSKVKQFLEVSSIESVAVVTLDKLLKVCPENFLNDWKGKGVTHVIVTMNHDGEVNNVYHLIIDTNPKPDPEVERLLGDEEMVVIHR